MNVTASVLRIRRRWGAALVGVTCLVSGCGPTAPQGDPRGGSKAEDPAYGPEEFATRPPVTALSPADQATHLVLQPGFRLEPVLTDPQIEEPAQIAFDGNGRMFVLEIRGLMQDMLGTDELAPIGRISRHEDRDNDGRYETHTIFVDHLVFPRFVMPFGADAVLTKESNADEVWKFTDTNRDGVADRKELFATDFGRLANIEHQESGLMWALDNWLYSTVNQVRLRWTPHGVLREPTGANGGQWGATQDDDGRVWFQQGMTGLPVGFQLPIAYGNATHPSQYEPNIDTIFGKPVPTADLQSGRRGLNEDGSVRLATASAGNDIFRGDRLPKDLIGDYFHGDPVGRVVRRLRPSRKDGLTSLTRVYRDSEFISSTDPLFRPVDVTTAPDGTLYVTDLYRGIVIEAQWIESYMRRRIEQHGLDRVVRRGRIWRVTADGVPRRQTPPRMLEESPAQWVRHLSDSNGWWRDTAQQLLVLRQDRSVAPALARLLSDARAPVVGRIHALWTLEGLGVLDARTLRMGFADPEPRLRVQALRASETLYKLGDRSLADDYRRLSRDSDVDVAVQAVLTLNAMRVPEAASLVRQAAAARPSAGLSWVANTLLDRPEGLFAADFLAGLGKRGFSPVESALIERGRQAYSEVCFACHGADGRGEPLLGEARKTRAPALAGAPGVTGHRDYVISVLLHGMTGPLAGRTYPEVMIPMRQQPDEWIAAVASYVRNAFGNAAPVVSAQDVARRRSVTASRTSMWTAAELEASLPRQLTPGPEWRIAASDNAALAPTALSNETWTSGRAQQAGMWFEVEWPEVLSLTELQFESPPDADRTVPATATAAPRTRAASADAAARPLGAPRAFEVRVSVDGTTWSDPVVRGTATALETSVAFPPQAARAVRVTLLTPPARSPAWTIRRLKLFGAPK